MQALTSNALVTATYSRRMELRLDSGVVVAARIKGKKIRSVCGDRVLAEPIPNEPDWLITEVLPRDNELSRPNSRGQIDVLAANIDLLVVVASDPPPPDWFIVDRYLSAAELMRVDAIVVFNKTDIASLDETGAKALSDYERVGYKTVRCSAKTGENLERLETALRDHTAIIVGQSGVGKSTIINQLADNSQQRTAAVSESSGEGRHTTVNSAMLDLRCGGAVIDSPGVRDFAPPTITAADVIHGFREIEEAGANCKFANCRHLREPDCAVKSSVQAGAISERRYESYKRLHVLTDKLNADRHGDR